MMTEAEAIRMKVEARQTLDWLDHVNTHGKTIDELIDIETRRHEAKKQMDMAAMVLIRARMDAERSV